MAFTRKAATHIHFLRIEGIPVSGWLGVMFIHKSDFQHSALIDRYLRFGNMRTTQAMWDYEEYIYVCKGPEGCL